MSAELMAEIIELKAQRDCDREAIANYERMVADHGGRAQKSSASAQLTADILSLYQERNEALAEVERLTGERDRLDSSVRFLQRCLKADRERLSLAEKLAERVRLRRGSLNAGDARALDAFISSASAERWACKTCGDTAIVARDANSKICWKCPSCMAMCSTPGDCDLEPECSFRPLSSPDHPTPPAQPSKDPGEDRIGGGLIIEPADRPYETVGDWAMANARKEVAARLTSLEEENAATKIVNSALNAECMGLKAGNAKLRAFRDAAGPETRERHRRRDINGLDWCSNPACIQKGRHPWPCPPIAALDATEPALVEEEREMAAQAPPGSIDIKTANEREMLELAWGIIANASGGDWSKENQMWQDSAAAWRDRWLALPQATPKDHARALAKALRKAGERFREYERLHRKKLDACRSFCGRSAGPAPKDVGVDGQCPRCDEAACMCEWEICQGCRLTRAEHRVDGWSARTKAAANRDMAMFCEAALADYEREASGPGAGGEDKA